MIEKINEFLDNKGISDKFIRDIVTLFIRKHTELYGNVIPFESLMERLNNNLNSIDLIDPSEKLSDPKYRNAVGCYEGFDKNSITMFFNKNDLNNPQLRESFINILIHELTHCAYTIKQNDLMGSEKHIFGTYEKLLDGKTPLVSGSDIYMEAIVNYISTCIFGKNVGMYIQQTNSIEKLLKLIDEKEFIRSAFNSDEEIFRSLFEILPEGAYEYYTKGMEYLNIKGEYGFKHGVEVMNNFFAGNIPNLTKGEKQIKELKTLRSSLSQWQPPTFSNNQQLEGNDVKKIKRQGFVNLFLLILILVIVVIITLLIAK